MTPKVLAQLLSNTHGMSPALDRIAKYVKKEPEKVIYQTITELSESAKSSEASVIRFCRDIGFTSFADFKMALAMELKAQNEAGDGMKPVESQTAQDAIEALASTADLIEEKLVKQVSKWLSKAPRVVVIGVGASSVIANYVEYRMVRLGINARAYSDSHMGVMAATQLDSNCVTICVSSTGSTVDIVKVAQIASRKGAKVIGISNTRKSPLAKVADTLLVASSPESPLTAGKLASKVGQLLLVDLLATEIFNSHVKFQKAYEETADATSDMLY